MILTLGYQSLKGPQDLITIATRSRAIVADVRFSARSRGWHETTLRRLLTAAGVAYERLPGLGNVNYRDASAPIQLADPEPEIERIRIWVGEQQRPVLLLCACRHIATCHRKVIADDLARRFGWIAEEASAGGRAISHPSIRMSG